MVMVAVVLLSSLLAVTVYTVEGLPTVGVPEMRPLCALRVMPAGSEARW